MQMIQQYDEVELKDGRTGCVVEAFEQRLFLVDVGCDPQTWQTLEVGREDIARVIRRPRSPERP